MSVTADKSRRHLLPRRNRHLQMGKRFLQKNKLDEAMSQFRDVLNLGSEHDSVSSEVFIALNKRLILAYKNQDLRLALSELYIEMGLYKDAIDELEDAIEIDPLSREIYGIISKLYSKTTGFKLKLQGLLEQAFEQGVLDGMVVDTLSAIYLKNKQYEKSIHMFRSLIKVSPDTVHYYKALAELYGRSKDFQSAADVYLDLFTRSPHSASEILDPLLLLSEQSPRNRAIRQLLIDVCFRCMKPHDAVGHIRSLLRHYPDDLGDCISTLKKAQGQFPNTYDILFALAELLIQAEDYSESVTVLQGIFTDVPDQSDTLLPLLDLIVSAYPNQLLAHQLMGDIYMEKGDYTAAFNSFERLIDLNQCDLLLIESRILDSISAYSSPEQSRAEFLLAKLHGAMGNYELALDYCDVLLESPERVPTRLLQSRLYNQQRRFDKSREVIWSSLCTDGSDWAMHSALRVTLNHSLSHCLSNFESSASEDITESDILDWGMTHLGLGNLYHAIEQFQKIDEDHDLALKASQLMGRAFMEMGRYDLAINQFQKCVSESSKASKSTILSCRYLIGLNFLLQGKITHALHNLELVFQRDMTFENVAAVIEKYKTDSFLDLRGKALSGAFFDADSMDHFVGFAMRNMENNTLFEDGANWQTLSFSHTHNNQGVDYALQQHYSSAEEEFKLAIQMDPKLTIAHSNLAYLYASKRRFEEAKTCLDAAHELNDGMDLIYIVEGMMLAMQKRYEDALNSFKKALTVNSSNTLATLHIGDVYFQSHDISKAVEHWKQAEKSERFFPLLQRRSRYLLKEDPDSDYWINRFDSQFSELELSQ